MSLEVFTGPMFSGKTTKATKKVTKYIDVFGGKALFINSAIDNRDEKNKVSSHSSMYKGLSKKIDVVMTKKLAELDVSQYQIIGVDEAQFFEDLYETVKKWIGDKKTVIVAGLDGDFQMKPFGEISKLLPIADFFIKLNAICSLCLAENKEIVTPYNVPTAPFTMRMKPKGDVIVDVGGSDKYKASCRKHHKIN